MDDGLDREKSRDIRKLSPALRFLRPYLGRVITASVALVVTASVTLSLGQGLRMVVDRGIFSGSETVLAESVVLLGLLVVLLTAGTFVRYYFVSWIGERVSADLRQAVFAHLVRLHPGFFEVNRPTEIQSRITTDTTLLQTVIGSSVSIALRNALMFVGGLVLLFVTNVKLSLIVIACVPVVVAPIVLFGRRVRNLSRSSQDRLADVGSQAGESLRNIKVVQSFNHEPLDITQFDARVNVAFDVAVHRIRQRAVLITLVMLLVMAAIGVMVWVGGMDVRSGAITTGELTAFIFYAFIVAGSVGAISEVYTDLQRAAGATERLVELLDAKSVLVEPAAPVPPAAHDFSLTLDSVGFVYPTRPDAIVLRNVSLAIAPGEMVALVGPSGAGKSTLFDLLQRFHDPVSGSIALGGVDLRAMSLADVRAAMGYVPQEPVLFHGTIGDNVRYGRPDAQDVAVWEALRQASADVFVRELPDGLDTVLGEGGAGLSGGQKQRLAVARALLTKPRILLLDEATSALDADSERAIRESVERLKGSCTILVIAHRLSTVRQADRIVVLESGAVVASGTHNELLRASPLYARFSGIQFGGQPTADGGQTIDDPLVADAR
ncbi:MAG: ATP-binding cassette domain-containing protein [Pseudomonadales bacterium]|nr:ATP-binding cassette domain-containing protein [Pseudomonadales bacterium]MCP5184528.1 ATP-binding cassette domain-containing protein [Pseudomonadales bacterium]